MAAECASGPSVAVEVPWISVRVKSLYIDDSDSRNLVHGSDIDFLSAVHDAP